MNVVPCGQDAGFRRRVEEFAEALRSEAHRLGDHGLSEDEFHRSGLFRAAVERVRGQFSAATSEKRDFARRVLSFLRDRGLVEDFAEAGGSNRHDFFVTMPSGRRAAIELKGCLDGNNTNIFERPAHADEFVMWSVCTNPGADPQKNARSGLHTRLSAEIISKAQVVDAVIVWDMVCGTVGRPCPKLFADGDRPTAVGDLQLPPPCVFVLPSTIPTPRNNPRPKAQPLRTVEFAAALTRAFGEREERVRRVDFEVAYRGSEIVRSTIVRSGVQELRLGPTPIRRA